MNNNNVTIESKIMDELLLRINEGKYIVNDKLPSDNELSEKYSVPRIKIRRVYERLEQMGYVYSLQGRGRFVKNRNENIALVLSGNESFTKKISEQGYDLESKNIFCEKIKYNERIYREMSADKEDEIYKIGRLRIVNGEPIAIHISYVSKKTFEFIDEEGKNIKSMFEYYRNKGFTKYLTEKSALLISYPTSEERNYLKCGELVPVVKLETNCKDEEKGIVLEYTEILYRGDRFKYEIQ